MTPAASIRMRPSRGLLQGLLRALAAVLVVILAAARTAAAIPRDDAPADASADAAAAPPVEQFGNALIPSPDSLSAAPSVTVRVDFARAFKPGTAPLVVATPYYRRLDSHKGKRVGPPDEELAPLLFAVSTLGVEATGFELHVERLDDRLPWRDAMVLVSWIAWDPEALSRSVAAGMSQGGQVPVPPEPEDDFTGDVVIEFPQPFDAPPVVIATARVGGSARKQQGQQPNNATATAELLPPLAAEPLTFALTFSKVTADYAVLDVFNAGEPGAWTELVHVDWRAWAAGGVNPTPGGGGPRGCEVGMVRMDDPEGWVELSRHFRADPLVLVSVLNDPAAAAASSSSSWPSSSLEQEQQQRRMRMRMRMRGPSRADGGALAPKSWDTYVATLHNISSSRFGASLAKVYQTQLWKDGVVLGYVAQNATRVCLDDCQGHGTCIDGRCACDPGWRGNNTCDTCQEGYWGASCSPCPALNATTGVACAGHGVCDGGGTMAGTGACLCELGYGGVGCDACAEGWYPDFDAGAALCSLCPRAGNATCAGHGSCEVLAGGDARVCVCNGAWAGTYCAECARGYGGEDCNVPCPGLCAGRGDCRVEEGGAAHCVCDGGWDDASMCEACAQGFYGPGCEGRCPDCGPNGACKDGVGGSGQCACAPGYTPDSLCRSCALGYYLDAADGTCSECPGGAANPCSGHSDPPGQCPDGLCVCVGGYHGQDCSAIDKDRGWAVILVIVLAGALFLGLATFAARSYWAARHGGDGGGGGPKDRRRTRIQGGPVDPELRKKLLERCPELSGWEQALSSMGSDAADWLIDFGKLELGARIGAGTSSLVYRGLFYDELVAVKRLQAAGADGGAGRGGLGDPALFGLFFRQEAELLSRLHHPHVVRFYGVSYHQGDFYIVTEHCSTTLAQMLQQHAASGERLDEEDMWRIAFQVANGMAYLHSKHVVHRDLKPENILLDERGDAKICDFGLSKLLSNNTQMTVQVGTPAYMCPEMAHGAADMNEAVDVYSFGVLLWAIWTCQQPYFYLGPVTPVQLLSRVVGGLRPRVDKSMPRELVDLMRACWEQDPAARPTFDALVAQLRALLKRSVQSRRSFGGASAMAAFRSVLLPPSSSTSSFASLDPKNASTSGAAAVASTYGDEFRSATAIPPGPPPSQEAPPPQPQAPPAPAPASERPRPPPPPTPPPPQPPRAGPPGGRKGNGGGGDDNGDILSTI